MLTLLAHALAENQLALPVETQGQLARYLELLSNWNRVYNLTTITEPHEMVYLHLIDSLMVLPFLHGQQLLDVGTGAGLPGIPLALADADHRWVLLDKAGKKTRFLTQVVAELGLKNVEIVQKRCEDFHYQPGFDSILSRAFGTLGLFAETTGHLLAQNGRLIAMKGKYPRQELDDLPAGIEVVEARRLDIKGMKGERHIIVLKRIERE